MMLIAGCASSPAAEGPKSVGGGTIKVRLNGDWNTFDPSGTTQASVAAYIPFMGAYDRLLSSLSDGKVTPYVAKAWTQPDPSTIVFELRSDVKCADGTPVTPTIVAKSLQRAFTAPYIANILGAGPYSAIPDDAANKLTVKWTTPNPDGLYGFASPYTSIICPAGLASPAQLTDKMFGSGAYTLTSAVHGDTLILAKNPAWNWGPSGITAKDLPDQLIFRVITSETTAANELLTGSIDVAQVVGPDVDRMIATKSLQAVSSSSYRLSPLIMNAQPGRPMADQEVRKAVMTAIDPKEWLKAAYNNQGVTGSSFFAKNSDCYEPATEQLMPTPSIQKAKEILAAAGYTAGSDGKLTKAGKPLAVIVAGSPALFGKGTEYMAAQLTSLGMTVTLKDLDRAQYVADYRAGNNDVSVAVTIGPNPAATQSVFFLAGPTLPKGSNFAFHANPKLDAALDAALAAPLATRCKAWGEFQLEMLRHNDIMPLAAQTAYMFTQQKIAVVMTTTQAFDPVTIRRVP